MRMLGSSNSEAKMKSNRDFHGISTPSLGASASLRGQKMKGFDNSQGIHFPNSVERNDIKTPQIGNTTANLRTMMPNVGGIPSNLNININSNAKLSNNININIINHNVQLNNNNNKLF